MANEEAIAEEFDLKPDEDQELEQVETIKDDPIPDEPEFSEAETKARGSGWRPKEEWNGPDDEWRNVTQYNDKGSMIDALRESRAKNASLEEANRKQLATNNQFHQQQTQILERDIASLKDELNEAIELADGDKARSIQGKIDDLNEEVTESKAAVADVPAVIPEVSPAITAWNAKNEWAMGATVKADHTRGEWKRIWTAGYTNGCDVEQIIEESLTKLDTFLAKEYPQRNANREAAATSVRGRSTHRQSNVQLTMADLTHDEKELHATFGSSYKDDKEFLVAVKNAREGVEK